MNSAIQDRVLAATMTCLRPLARALLRYGINYRQFAEAAKNAFLEEAASERDARGRGANVSRIAVRTGLSRKEVARLRDKRTLQQEPGGDLAARIQHASHAARTLQVWYSDARFVDSAGKPKELPYSGDSGSFSALVRVVGGDVPAGAGRAELLAARQPRRRRRAGLAAGPGRTQGPGQHRHPHHAQPSLVSNMDYLMLLREGRIDILGPRDEVLARLGLPIPPQPGTSQLHAVTTS